MEQVDAMLIKGPIWGLAGFSLGVVLSAVAVAALGSSAPTPSSPSFDKPHAQAPAWSADASPALPQRIVVSLVKNDEVEAAVNSFAAGAQRKIRKEVDSGKYRLVWLTLWDWDTAEGEVGNTISLLSGDYRRFVTLTERRARVAIPEPKSGLIEVRGETSEDDNISVSLLSGTQPIALPVMTPGQAVKLQIDVSEPAAVSANSNATFSPVPPLDVY
jgi:hypothetical protein